MLIDILDDLLYTVFKPNFECFRKVRYFAKFFVHRQEKTRYASRVPCFRLFSCGVPAAHVLAQVAGVHPAHHVAVLQRVLGAAIVGVRPVDAVHPAG